MQLAFSIAMEMGVLAFGHKKDRRRITHWIASCGVHGFAGLYLPVLLAMEASSNILPLNMLILVA